MRAEVTLRPVRPEDGEFLYTVYAGTRAEEMALLDWAETEKEEFLRMQFDAQTRFYKDQFGDARFMIIERERRAIGRLYLHWRPDEIRIVDIALLADHRGRGIGSALLRRVLEDASRDSLAVRIHVERNNPARRLYHRLGFVEVGGDDVYLLMEWSPPAGAGGQPPREGDGA